MCIAHRNPLHCILPPYMTEKLDKWLGKDANTIEDDNNFRNKRKVLAAMPQARKAMRMAAGPANNKLYREVYDAHESPMSLGELVWKEGQSPVPTNKEARNVIEGAGNVWNFYKKLFNRNSINNNGMPIIQTVRFREHSLKPFVNAFWDGQQMFYGTGIAKVTNSFTSDLDIIAHELTHGVIDFEAMLAYENQSGALNESFADVFGILVKQWTNNTPAKKSNWLIGSNILKGKNALRSLKAPGMAFKNDPVFGDDPQPAHMKQFMKLPNTDAGDFGGVHFNSGIPNHAFYITSMELGGNAWEKAGAVWYAALTDKKVMGAKADFKGAAKATMAKADALFGKGSLVTKAVEKGWKDTGVI